MGMWAGKYTNPEKHLLDSATQLQDYKRFA
jgi:hypothetical protein